MKKVKTMAEGVFQDWLAPYWKSIQEFASTEEFTTACLALFLLAWIVYTRIWRKPCNLPPGPRGVPILGYLPFLGRKPYRELDRLKNIYGNVFSLYLGNTLVVVLGDFEAVKEAFSKPTTLDRPERLFDFMPDGVGLSGVNGQEWVEQRKFCVKSMRELGVGKDKWEETIQEEVEDFVKTIASYNGREFDISRLLTSSVSNNISYFVYGRRLPMDDPNRNILDRALEDVTYSFSQSSLGTYFPVLRDLQAKLGIGTYGKFYDSLKKLNDFFKKEVEKIRKTYKEGEVDNFTMDYLRQMDKMKGKSGHYFNGIVVGGIVYSLFPSIRKECFLATCEQDGFIAFKSQGAQYAKETNMYGNIQVLFGGGSDTTAASLQWLLLTMAKFPDIQAKVQNEVDAVLGKCGKIRWSEKTKLPYTYATIMEGQRWITISPINTARIATEDIKILNYDVPKGTTILANNWGLHNDPKYWKNPEKFDPGRFLNENKEIILKPDSYNPFSYGKRNCPGETIAMMELLLYFTALMQNFMVKAPEGKELIMEGNLGLTYQAVPQDLHFIPRGGDCTA